MRNNHKLHDYDSLEFGQYLKKDSNLGALIILFGASGVSLLELFQGNSVNFVVMSIFAAFSIFYLLRKRAEFRRLRELPRQPILFHPFSTMNDIQRLSSYYRRPETKQLMRALKEHNDECIVLVGDSGVGKSILLDPLLREMCDEERTKFLKIDEYFNPLVKICDLISKIDGAKSDIKQLWISLRTSIDNGSQPSEEMISQCLDSVFELPPVVFAFDQSERLLLSVLNDTDSTWNVEHRYLFGRVVQKFVQAQNIAVIFAVRGDTFFNSVQGLKRLLPDINHANDADVNFHYEYLYGISDDRQDNQSTKELSSDVIDFRSDISELRTKLSKDSAQQFNAETFLRSIAFFDKMRANTFISKIAGFLVEHFYDSDSQVRRAAQSDGSQQETYLNIFLQYVVDGFMKKHGYSRKSVIEVTLYTLARYNSSRGRPADKKTIADISHFPEEYVSQAVDYLRDNYIIAIGNHNEYRVIHDLISREVLRSDVLKLNSNLRSSIDYLCEHHVPHGQFVVQPQPAYQLVTWDLFKRQEIAWSRAFLFFLAFIGLWRIAFPKSLYNSLEGYHSVVRMLDPSLIQTFDFNGLYALPYVLTLLVYALFVHYITYGYLTHVVEGRFSRAFMHSILPLGGGFGAINVFVPVMLVTPIFICGIMVVIMFMVTARQNKVVGDAQKEALSYAGRTALNISFAWLILTAILAQAILNYDCVFWFAETWPVSRSLIILIVLVAMASVLLWGVQHIRSEQASQEAWSRRFALITKSLVVERRRQGRVAD